MNALAKWRHALDYSQNDMAKLIGASLDTYIKWEVGTRTPSRAAGSHIILLRWLADNWPQVFQQIANTRVGK